MLGSFDETFSFQINHGNFNENLNKDAQNNSKFYTYIYVFSREHLTKHVIFDAFAYQISEVYQRVDKRKKN